MEINIKEVVMKKITIEVTEDEFALLGRLFGSLSGGVSEKLNLDNTSKYSLISEMTDSERSKVRKIGDAIYFKYRDNNLIP